MKFIKFLLISTTVAVSFACSNSSSEEKETSEATKEKVDTSSNTNEILVEENYKE